MVDGELTVRKVTELTLTCDHRVCDGGTAAGFLRYVADSIESTGAGAGRHIAAGESWGTYPVCQGCFVPASSTACSKFAPSRHLDLEFSRICKVWAVFFTGPANL